MPSNEGLIEYTVSASDAIDFIVDSPTGYAEVSPDGHFRWVNQAYANLLNAHREQILGTHWKKWTHPEDVNLDADLARKVAAGQLRQYRMVKRYKQLGSTDAVPRIIWGQLSVFGKFSSEGVFIGYRVTFVPYLNHDSSEGSSKIDYEKWLHSLLRLLADNWKTAVAVILTLVGSTFANSGRLLEQLQEIQETKEKLDGASPFFLPSPASAPSGPSSPNIDSTK